MTTTPDPRAQVLNLARAGHGRNEVARRTGIPPTTVTRIAAEAGVTFDRSATAVATQARVVDAKARRSILAAGILDDLDDARQHLRDATDAKDLFFAAKAVDALASAHVRLVAVDGPQDGMDEAKSMLGALHEALIGKWGEQPATAHQGDADEDGRP
ncbi:helix-turn-helix domain-containing protein [Streptomyces sp. C1-2]|uniref:helix-turn-helix domain-containing protein n=1 Tax=Streptomyces sp. C1-2 TaxID=2720022 RepID=UPI0019D02C87|nr:helix-turn-helix domain-containing protein [Streptomyces sp. C1-2]